MIANRFIRGSWKPVLRWMLLLAACFALATWWEALGQVAAALVAIGIAFALLRRAGKASTPRGKAIRWALALAWSLLAFGLVNEAPWALRAVRRDIQFFLVGAVAQGNALGDNPHQTRENPRVIVHRRAIVTTTSASGDVQVQEAEETTAR